MPEKHHYFFYFWLFYFVFTYFLMTNKFARNFILRREDRSGRRQQLMLVSREFQQQTLLVEELSFLFRIFHKQLSFSASFLLVGAELQHFPMACMRNCAHAKAKINLYYILWIFKF
jgi:hypothetical protein